MFTLDQSSSSVCTETYKNNLSGHALSRNNIVLFLFVEGVITCLNKDFDFDNFKQTLFYC